MTVSDEFFLRFSLNRHNVLEITDGIDKPGAMNWEMFGCLLLAWVLVYFCIWKGIRTTGKASEQNRSWPVRPRIECLHGSVAPLNTAFRLCTI